MTPASDEIPAMANRETAARIVVSKEGDGAFAVVDAGTPWRSRATVLPDHVDERHRPEGPDAQATTGGVTRKGTTGTTWSCAVGGARASRRVLTGRTRRGAVAADMTAACPARAQALLACALLLSACKASPPPPPQHSLTEDLLSVDLQVETEPPGAGVFVDGADSGKKTPAKLPVATGKEYLVELRHPDFLSVSEKVFAAPGKPIPVKATLKAGARVTTTSEPAGAHVEIDGKEAFVAPGKSPPMAPGVHLLVMRLPDHAAEAKRIKAVGSEQLEWHARLAPGAIVKVHSTPAGAAIDVDGKPVGQVTPADVVVPLGKKHQLGLLLKGFGHTVRKLPPITAKAAPLQLEVTLDPPHLKELNAQLVALEKRIKLNEAKLKKLNAKRSGFMVQDTKKEIALEKSISAIESELDRQQADLGALREELDKAE
jgi:hypothetical protein